MKKTFKVADRQVGGDAPCLFIAEAGVAHFGDMGMARDLVNLAAEGNSDVFKIQIFDVDTLLSNSAAEWKDRLRPRNLTLDQVFELKEMVEAKGMLFMATAHDQSRLPWLKELDLPAVKVGSGERGNHWFLKKLAELGKPMIISTGMYAESDVVEMLDALAATGNDELALLHCVTSYPTPAADVNLAAMDNLSRVFEGPVGYSDHTEDGLAVLGAVARGAKIIEKHITILRDIPNAQDWKVSAGPEDLAKLVSDIRRMELMIGSDVKTPAECEQMGMSWALKSVVAAQEIEAGQVLSESNLITKRPGGGIPANRMEDLFGRVASRHFAQDEKIDYAGLE
ncbi:N-acetylneuraminate synthase family protein [Thalassospira povalilytica]|uniref:N-acetylneuraminate synthase family protein n=1 Tax=Thalassospira povalilytica TaxID=732237 RepID=UPI001D195406|nr:N-acetylneuraminate synthase family protein [Thalassospira povalilytica]MCC4241918.1 N-acetylneuraminate synthase family protein [Thalassospira povalilytica]